MNLRNLKYYNFNRHFNWQDMNTNRNSYFLSVLTLDRKLKKAISNNPIKQSKLGEIFE